MEIGGNFINQCLCGGGNLNNVVDKFRLEHCNTVIFIKFSESRIGKFRHSAAGEIQSQYIAGDVAALNSNFFRPRNFFFKIAKIKKSIRSDSRESYNHNGVGMLSHLSSSE